MRPERPLQCITATRSACTTCRFRPIWLVRDPFEKNRPGLGLGRDPVRTPMQWSDGQQPDFSTAEPWLPLADDFMNCNVSVERGDADSLLALYRRLIQLRRTEPALSVGDYSALPSGDDVMAYIRKASDRWLLIVLNFGAQARSFNLNDRAILLLSTRVDREQEELSGEVSLLGNEGVIVALS